MFIGHYAVALALKKTEPRAKLGVLFIAVQLADFMFFPLAMIGIERASFIPGLTEASPLRLDFAPFSHSLVGARAASAIVGAAFILLKVPGSTGYKLGLVMGLAVLSHWVLDVVSHTPDMPLVDGGLPKLGLGLWKSAIATYLVEALMVLGGLWTFSSPTGRLHVLSSGHHWYRAGYLYAGPDRSVTPAAGLRSFFSWPDRGAGSSRHRRGRVHPAESPQKHRVQIGPGDGIGRLFTLGPGRGVPHAGHASG